MGLNHYDYNNLLSGCAGQQFAEESACCRFTACRLICGRACGGYLKKCLMALVYLPLMLFVAVAALVFSPLSVIIALIYLMQHGYSDEFVLTLGWIFIGTPLLCPVAAVAVALQLVYFPLALVICLWTIMFAGLSKMCGRSDSNIPDFIFEIPFWLGPLCIFGYVVWVMTSDVDD